MEIEMWIAYEHLPAAHWEQLREEWRQESAQYYDLLPEYDPCHGCGFHQDQNAFWWKTRGGCKTLISYGEHSTIIQVRGHRSGCRWPFDSPIEAIGYQHAWNALPPVVSRGVMERARRGGAEWTYQPRRTLLEGDVYLPIAGAWRKAYIVRYVSRCPNPPWEPADWGTRDPDHSLGGCDVYGDIVRDRATGQTVRCSGPQTIVQSGMMVRYGG